MTALFLVAALLVPGPHPPAGLTEASAQVLAADVICGEAGRKDEYLANMVAAVITNRMADVAGTRAEKTHRVLLAPRQFNGSCARRGLEPTDWHRHLAQVLVSGEHRQIPRPAWLTSDVKFFTEARTARRWLRRLSLAGKRGGMWFFRERRRNR